MVKATHADWEKARGEREAWAGVIADSVAKGETPWPTSIEKYITARDEMKRIDAELDAEAGA